MHEIRSRQQLEPLFFRCVFITAKFDSLLSCCSTVTEVCSPWEGRVDLLLLLAGLLVSDRTEAPAGEFGF